MGSKSVNFRGKTKTLFKHLSKVIALDDSIVDAHSMLAQLHYQNSDIPNATLSLNKALSLSPGSEQLISLQSKFSCSEGSEPQASHSPVSRTASLSCLREEIASLIASSSSKDESIAALTWLIAQQNETIAAAESKAQQALNKEREVSEEEQKAKQLLQEARVLLQETEIRLQEISKSEEQSNKQLEEAKKRDQQLSKREEELSKQLKEANNREEEAKEEFEHLKERIAKEKQTEQTKVMPSVKIDSNTYALIFAGIMLGFVLGMLFK